MSGPDQPNNPQIWNRATIVGCGLIGASFARALRQHDLCGVIAGWDTDRSSLDTAIELGVIDEVDERLGNAEVSQSDSDLIYLATPVRAIIAFIRERSNRVKPGAIVTDAGSTKLEITLAAKTYFPTDRFFIPGHPLAGSHHSGPEHSNGSLFNDAVYILVADGHGEASVQLAMLSTTLKTIGARIQILDALEHDRRMAIISHLPQLISSALVASALDRLEPKQLPELAGAGFRDMSRLAASPWSMWQDILLTNPGPISEALDIFVSKITKVRDELAALSANESGENHVNDLQSTRATFGLLDSKSPGQ